MLQKPNIGKKLDIVGEVVYEESPIVEAQNLKLNITKAKEKLGYTPIWNADLAIEATFNWYNSYYQQKSSAKDLIDKDLKNYLNQV